jgi:heme-degrading monooxygenase HmoA
MQAIFFEMTRMIVRLWTVKVDPARIEQYELWERTRSLPMFAKLTGCLGVMFLRLDDSCCALSFWRDMNAVNALKQSELYVRTSQAYESSGMLVGAPILQVFEAIGGFTADLLPQAIARLDREIDK